MPAFITDPALFRIAVLLGISIMILGCLVSALAYRGKEDEPYSPVNHFISELGEIGVARRAWAFNAGAVLCGLILLPANVILGSLLTGALAKAALAFGVLTCLSLMLVGFFSMDRYPPHAKAAIAFFRCGLMTVFLFSLAIAFQPADTAPLPRAAALAGIPTLAAFIWFLYLAWKAHQRKVRALEADAQARPKVLMVAVAEWAVFIGIVGWFLTLAMLV